MATPILKIPIDDAAFQRYLRTFAKYQAEVAKQPDMWKGINTTLGDTAIAGAAIAAEIAHQTEQTRLLAREEEKRETAARAAAKRKRDQDKEEQKRDEEAAARRRRAIDQVKKYAEGLKQVAEDAAKWTLGGGLVGLVGGAMSLWGLGSLVSGVGAERRQASGMGVSMGQRQGMGLNMQRYFDVNSVMENVANMQSNPGSWGTFRMMGINPQGKDPAALTYEAAAAARRMFIADKGNLMLAQAQGLTNVFSPDDLRRMSSESPGEFNKSMRQGRQFTGLSDDVGRKWQNFEISLETATLKVKNTLIDKLTVLERNGSLDKIIAKFGQLAIQVLDRIDFDLLGKGLDTFTKYITSPQFQQDFKDMLDNISVFARKLEGIISWLPDFSPDPNRPSKGAGPAGVPSSDGIVASPFPGVKFRNNSANMNWLGQAFQKWGWDEGQTKGMLGNIDLESKANPFAVGDNGHAYGIAQWHADRRALYAKIFRHTMESVTNRGQALLEQAQFMHWELTSNKSSRKKAGDALRKTHNAFTAGWIVSKDYEAPAGGNVTAFMRGAHSMTVTLKNQTGASVATTTNSAAGGK